MSLDEAIVINLGEVMAQNLSKMGQEIKFGDATLILGECIELMNSMPAESVDMIFAGSSIQFVK